MDLVGLARLDSERRIVDIDLRGAAILGKARRDLLGKSFLALVARADRDGLSQHLEHCRIAQKPGSTVVRLAGNRVGPLTIRLVTLAVLPNGRADPEFSTAIVNIGELQMAWEGLKENEIRFRDCLANSPVTVFMQDRDLRYIWVHNGRANFSSAKTLGRSDGDLFEEEIAAPLEKMKRRALRTGVGTRAQIKCDCDGKPCWLDLSVEPVRDRKHQICGVQGVMFNISALAYLDRSLRVSEERYRRIVTTAEEGVWTINRREKTTFVNPKMAQMLGCTVEEMEGRSVRCFLDSKSKPLFAEKIKRRKSGITERYEMKLRRKDGSTFWALVSSAPIHDPQGNYAGSLAMVTDVDERRRVEEILERSEERYRLVADGTKTGFWDWDLKTDRVYYSPGWKALLGYREDELSDSLEEFYRLCHPEDIADTMAQARAAIAALGAVFEAEFRLRHKDGSWRSFWSHGVVIRNEDGEGGRMIGRNLDITERKRAEVLLRRSEERYRLVADAGKVGFWDWDLKSDRVYYSSIWKAQLGYADDEIGDSFEEFGSRVYTDDRDAVSAASRDAINSGSRQFVVEFRMLHKDGTWRWMESRGMIVRDPLGTAIRVLGTHLDISDRKETEATLRLVNVALEARVTARTAELASANDALREEIAERKRLESELLAIAEREQRRIGRDLHDDLGQQLTAMMMQAVALKTRLQRESSSYESIVNEMVASLREAIGTTRNLARGLYPLVVEQGGLEAALDVLATRTQAATGRSCILQVGETWPLPTETAVHLYRIAQEGVSNAIRHGNARRIMIRWGIAEGVGKLEILNDGEPFVRENSNRDGLGLYMIEKRAKMVGGTVEIGERSPGRWGIVCVLPAQFKQRPPEL